MNLSILKLNLTVKSTFLIVYFCISIATFYHSAWGFATLQGATPEGGFSLFVWWLIGGLSAFAIDVGMGAVVYALIKGHERNWLHRTLYLLAIASAYSQIIFATHHAFDYQPGQIAPWLAWLDFVLEARVLILPTLLPGFAIFYAFAAKMEEPTQPTNKLDLSPIELKVLEFISEQGQVSRNDISAEFKRSPSFATSRIKPLLEHKLITETKGKLTSNGVFHAN